MKHPTPHKRPAKAVCVTPPPKAIDFKLLAESTSDVIIRCGMDGVARYVSPSVEQLLGVSPGDLLGKSHRSFILAEDLPLLMKTIDRHRAGHAGGRVAYRMRRPDGRIVWVESIGQTLRDPKTGSEDLIVVLRDITERKTLEAQLEMLALTAAPDRPSTPAAPAGAARPADKRRDRSKTTRLFN